MINKKYYLALAPALLMTSCADYFDTANYLVEQPESDARLAYLDEYKPMKEYVNRSAHPGFLLGTGVNAEEFIKGEGVYLLTKSNFDMVTAGNAMKYASVVADNGDMNFGTVRDFVAAAENAGLQVYGHTLCWHSQQNIKWLNSLLADKEIEFDPSKMEEVVDYELDFGTLDEYSMWHQNPDGATFTINKQDGTLDVYNPTAISNFWELQYFVFDNVNLEKGREYELSVTVRGTGEGAIQGNVGGWSDNAGIRIGFTPDWETKTITFTNVNEGGSHGLFQSGDFAGTIQYKNLKISHKEAPSAVINMPLIGTADGSQECANLIARVKGNGDVSAPIVNDAERGPVYKCEILPDPVDAWDCQFFIKSNEALQAGDKVSLSFMYRTDDSRNIESQAHGEPGNYHHWSCIGTLASSNEWKEHKFNGTVSSEWAGDEGFISVALNLSSAAGASAFYIDDVQFTVERAGNTQPLTPAEKAEILDAELDRWIGGMMDATEGKVKAWDVVNEPLQDTWGNIDLKHDPSGSDPNNFYWQDYLGDNYVRNVVKYAREHYARQEGTNPEDLKLFINDYNLEAAYNNNDKCTSLVNWIKKWEEDGVTKIDGIGSQMHVSYSMNPDTQRRNEEAVVNMLKILANSGKLIRITELDMGINDADGNEIKTENVTFEQHKAMGEYYRFIINKYFEIIPQAQQFGICQWAQTDSPEGSGWRAGCPIGLWNLNYQRKPAYGSVCDAYSEN